MRASKKSFLSLVALLVVTIAFSQEKEKIVSIEPSKTTTVTVDSTSKGVEKKVRVYNPKTAAIRSAILPGLGQIYNKKYWKLPIVYGALGVSGAIFFYNLTNYRDTRFAYQAMYKASQPNATLADSADYFKIKHPLERYSLQTLKYYRDSFRRDIDYSALVFVVLWGLNVADAAVDAHLKAFDVSPDLSMRFKPGKSRMAGTTGLSVVFNIGKNINPRPLLPTANF
ncbi:MAG: hypothetical protein E6H09_05890 [Bacteroidetes bacterium]|jgi:hypothetical protein|nr:MAG: hypothetical protein E6H09_05890 [Bacteroidota bacterium]